MPIRIAPRAYPMLLAFACMGVAGAKEADFVMSNDKVASLTKFLEEKPLDKDAPLVRRVLLNWEDTSKDVIDVVCPGVLAPVPDKVPYGPELAAQFVFGSAAFQLLNPGEKGKLMRQQLAGMQSMLKAYRAIVSEDPKARVPRLDELAQRDLDGNLLQTLEPLVLSECKTAK